MRRVLVTAVALLGLCSCSPPLSGDGTGVPGLDTPSQILSNPFVADVLAQAEDLGVNLNLSTAVDPPVISGTYDISGEQLIPGMGQLNPGTFIWENQTSDNQIDTRYDQLFQSGLSSIGEIIRGSGTRFTVHSILSVSQFGCDEEVIFIVDGVQDSSGNVSATYVGTPVGIAQCFTPSAGILELTLTGAPKTKHNKEGAPLMARLPE